MMISLDLDIEYTLNSSYYEKENIHLFPDISFHW
jgi:hypothetical protein